MQKKSETHGFRGMWKTQGKPTHKGIWFSLKKKGNSGTCYNMEEPGGQYAEWNKQVAKEQMLNDSTQISYLEPNS